MMADSSWNTTGATDCPHPRLVKVLNMGPATYRCDKCKALVTVTIAPFRIEVVEPETGAS